MYVSTNCDVALFRTPFNATHDLVQKFRGVNNESLTYNAPVDFMEAGLIDNSKWDFWHVDVPFNYSNDEATPPFINKEYIGANHGQPCAVAVLSPEHGKTFADIGSLWKDQNGTLFTLIRIKNEQALEFLSQNVGVSECYYQFVTKISGNLEYVENGKNTTPIEIKRQYRAYLSRSNRYHKKDIIIYKDGASEKLFGGANCDYAEIQETYDIINPATVADDLRARRPKDGYTKNVDLSWYGTPMARLDLVYRVMPDGAILCLFDVNKLMDVDFHHYMGVMFQEKLDVYGGGAYRIIPKTKTLDCEEGDFDFTCPVALYGKPYPSKKKITPEYFSNPDSPPDRIIDLFKNREGNYQLGFSAGFLPIYDCAPEIRKNNLDNAVSIKGTRKAYPNAASGSITNLKGVGYKKFFLPQNNQSVYTVEFEGKKYIFVDVISKSTVSVDIDKQVKVIEKDGVEWMQDRKSLTVSGEKGYAVFLCE